MALLETLRLRAARKGGTAQVDCGELGVLTVESLSPADCVRLTGDSRSLLYAACRELQTAGEALRSEGKLFRPDEITAYLTDDEADIAARTVLELSGVSGIRPQSVQAFEEGFSEIRPQSVQAPGGQTASANGLWDADEEIRLSPVQTFEDIVKGNGQVSREFSGAGRNFGDESPADKKAQILGDLSSRTAQILVSEKDEGTQSSFSKTGAAVDLHEIESELQRQGRVSLHETESELRKNRRWDLHETTSEFSGRRGILLHETESESAMILHEIESELKRALHEIKSEVQEMLHETESELAEKTAQRLAEALLRAGQVR